MHKTRYVTVNENELVRIEAGDPQSAEVLEMLHRYVEEVVAATGPTDKPPAALELAQDDYLPPLGAFLVVRDDDGSAVGCAGLRMLDEHTAELKRMWIDPAMRGRGAAQALLAAWDAAALDHGAVRGVLDTRVELTAARRLYESSGWYEVPPYNDNTHATHWYAKTLTPAAAADQGS